MSRAALLALVPGDAILDRHRLPNPRPSIIFGEVQELDAGFATGGVIEIIHPLHVWVKEPSLLGVRRIGWEIRQALRAKRPYLQDAFHCAGWSSTARYLRDPDGVTSHGVITVAATLSGGGL